MSDPPDTIRALGGRRGHGGIGQTGALPALKRLRLDRTSDWTMFGRGVGIRQPQDEDCDSTGSDVLREADK